MLESVQIRRIALALAAVAGLAACASDPTSVDGGGAGTAPAAGSAVPTRTGPPALTATVVAGGLEHAWDVGVLPDGPGASCCCRRSRPGRR